MIKLQTGISSIKLKQMRKKDLKALGMKKCKTCDKIKWIHKSFTKQKTQANCNPCHLIKKSENQKRWRGENPERSKYHRTKWYEKNSKEYHRDYYHKKRKK